MDAYEVEVTRTITYVAVVTTVNPNSWDRATLAAFIDNDPTVVMGSTRTEIQKVTRLVPADVIYDSKDTHHG